MFFPITFYYFIDINVYDILQMEVITYVYKNKRSNKVYSIHLF